MHFNITDVLMPAFGGVPVGGILTAGGPCGASGGGLAFFTCTFTDAAFMPAVANNWAWESGILNPNPGALSANVGFFFPGGPILGHLTLGAGSRFHIGIVTEAAVVEHTNVLPGGALFNGDF